MDRLNSTASTSFPVELSNIYATVPVGLCCVDRDLRIVSLNDQFARISGRPGAAHIGKTLRELVPRIADLMEPVCLRVLATGKTELDVELRGADVPDVDGGFVCSYAPVRDEQNRVVGVNAVVRKPRGRLAYVAALREMNESLRQRDEFLRVVGDRLRQAALFRVVHAPDGGYRFAYLSEGAAEVTGLPAGRLLREPSALVDAIVDADRPSFLEAMAAALQTLSPFDQTFRIRWPNGTVHWCHFRSALRPLADGSVMCEGIMLNTTNLHRVQEALTDSLARNEAILSALPDLVFVLSADGTYLDVHPRDDGRLLLPTDQFLGKTVAEIMPPDLACRFADSFAQVAMEGSAELGYSLVVDGETRHYEARMVGCGADRILAIVRDVTDTKRAQHELEISRRELARISRLTMLGEITASLAHELNQPLAAIVSNAQAGRLRLSNNPVDDGEVTEMLTDIAEASMRAGDVIRRVRAWVTRDQLVPQDIDVNEVVADVERLLHSELIIRKVQLTLSLDPDLPAVSADRIQLQQVILNLALNGMEAMHDRPVSERQLVIATSLLDRAVQVAVRDRGIGIDRTHMSRLFDPFFTTKPSGLGIGLSICSSIVNAYGGRIWAENNAHSGATMFFTLPCTTEMA